MHNPSLVLTQTTGRHSSNVGSKKMEFCTNHCIVTFMDLIDVKKLISLNSPNAVQIMQEFHQTVYGQVNETMKKHEHAYAWNDSVLLVAYIDENYSGLLDIMKELDNLKKRIDEKSKCYAISVKGMTFSEPLFWGGHQFVGQIDQPKFVFLKASSYAFSNCFEIEKRLGDRKKSWYIDERIASLLNSKKKYETESINMLPSGKDRKVYLFDGYLW